MFRQVEVGWRKVKADRFLDILARFCLRVAGRRTARQFRTYCGIALSHGIVFEYHAELHSPSICSFSCIPDLPVARG